MCPRPQHSPSPLPLARGCVAVSRSPAASQTYLASDLQCDLGRSDSWKPSFIMRPPNPNCCLPVSQRGASPLSLPRPRVDPRRPPRLSLPHAPTPRRLTHPLPQPACRKGREGRGALVTRGRVAPCSRAAARAPTDPGLGGSAEPASRSRLTAVLRPRSRGCTAMRAADGGGGGRDRRVQGQRWRRRRRRGRR